jgi:hypothetical protein
LILSIFNTQASHEIAIIDNDLEIIRLKLKEVLALLANSMNQMPSSLYVGNVYYPNKDLNILVLDDCFPIIKEDGLLVYPTNNSTITAQMREISSQVG